MGFTALGFLSTRLLNLLLLTPIACIFWLIYGIFLFSSFYGQKVVNLYCSECQCNISSFFFFQNFWNCWLVSSFGIPFLHYYVLFESLWFYKLLFGCIISLNDLNFFFLSQFFEKINLLFLYG